MSVDAWQDRILWIATISFVFLLPVNDISLVTDVPVVERFTIGMMFGGIAVGLWSISVINKRIISFRRQHVYALLFAIWAVISLIWTVNPGYTLLRVIRYIFNILIFLVLWDVLSTDHKVEHALKSFICGSWLLSIIIYTNYILNSPFKQGRFSGGGFGPNGAAGILALSLPIAIYMIGKSESSESASANKAFVGLCLVYIPAAFGAIILTGSRHALIATALITFAYILKLGFNHIDRVSWTSVTVVVGAFIPIGTLVLFALPSAVRLRLMSLPSDIANADLHGRLPRWIVGIQTITDRPITGFGAGAYHTAVEADLKPLLNYLPPRFYADNMFVSLPVNLGLVGLIMFLAIYVSTIHDHIAFSTKYVSLWVSVFIVLGIIGAMNPWAYRPTTWALTSIAVASTGISNVDIGK